jgi:DNA-cytosine methyltransferase
VTSELTHASFFSGVGGTDLGLEAAGWRTVSFSEIDPYANAVLAERWPGVPNLGDITAVVRPDERSLLRGERRPDESSASGEWTRAVLWSGGFPCQDLSVAGKRAGFAGERSVLAFAFLDLVGQHRPPAVLLENVPGLLSSHRGRDMATLLGRLAELGYGVAYRILDARHFGVPQRRRRVFILGLRCGPDDPDGRVAAERAAEVLSVGTRCDRHPATGEPKGPNAAHGVGAGISRALSTSQERIDADTESFIVANSVRPRSGMPQGWNSNFIVSPPPDADRVRAADGLAGRAHHSVQVDGSEQASTLRGFGHGWQGQHMSTNAVYTKSRRAQTDTDDETWVEGEVMPTINAFDVGDVRTTAAILGPEPQDDPLLPLGLDSHRYRCCGNGVVAPVAEWIGRRLADVFAE